MPRIERSALVPYSAEQMFQVVTDVTAYPDFLPWCSASRVIESSATEQVAELELSQLGMTQRFVTRNELTAPSLVRINLVQGPFRRLDGEWRFTSLGKTGCKVELSLQFDVESRVLGSVLVQVWEQASDKMVDAFCRRAESCYE